MRSTPALPLGLLLLWLVWIAPSAVAREERPPGTWDGAACEAAAEETEREAGLPPGLLRAIGIVESGRWQPALARSAPWPYAIDAGGYSMFMESLEEAAAKVAALRQQGLQSIDVGCFQINLLYHPEAFASIEEAFDPRANAAYAARFLLSLYSRVGNWEEAVADYHSAVVALGEPYRAKVYEVWKGSPTMVTSGRYTISADFVPSRPTTARQSSETGVAAGWSAFSLPTRHVSIHVYQPTVPTAFAASRPAGPNLGDDRQTTAMSRPHLVSMVVSRKRGLPTIFTPTGGL
jgi:hypothetical protein